MDKPFKIINLQEEDEKCKNDDIFSETPSNKKEKKLVKPDFSPILFQETQFGFKSNGSYKKVKYYEPESPLKFIKKNYTTPAKIEGRDLFNSKMDRSFCRKLNFNDGDDVEKDKKSNKIKKINNQMYIKDFGQNFLNQSFLNNNNESFLKQNKMENEFKILKTIKKEKLDFIYKVEEKKTKNILCIKKIYKNSQKNNINNTQVLFNDMNKTITYKNIMNENLFLGYDFCNHYKDFWLEEEILDLAHPNFMPEKFLYILYDYYPNGDLLDYLGKLIDINYKFTPDFYWDIIFEMIVGLKYFHELGYLHLDIKPSNFLVDQNGYIKLSDFGLCHKISEIPFLNDIVEGDKIYISKELLNFNSKREINTKTDIFSLGLSILEIMANINLPSYGESWTELRSEEFQIKDILLQNWNITERKEDFIKLISKMIAPIDKREDLNEIINNFEDLKKRYELLKNNDYKKFHVIPDL